MKILISNDDGWKSEGIQELFFALKKAKHKVIMVAPERERSTMSHALTLHKPLRLIRCPEPDQYYLSGTPADCIYVGLRHKDIFKPDIVISGINRGANLGTDIHYSGTVSCAREASLSGVPSIAVSLVMQHDFTAKEKVAAKKKLHFDSAAKLVAELLPRLVALQKHAYRLININIPNLPRKKIRGVRLGFLGDRRYEGDLLYRSDPRGKPYIWIGGTYSGYTPMEGSDNSFVSAGYAAVTPVTLDMTDYPLMEEMRDWNVEA